MKARSGFTLVELLMVVLLSAIVMGSIYQMIIVQQRSDMNQRAVIETQQNERAALAVITGDLKEISAADGDITAADSLSLTFRALTKAGFSCAKSGSDDWLDVAVMGQPFVAGDTVYVFEENDPATGNDDSWLRLDVSSVAASTIAACGNVNPLGATSWQRLTFSGSVLANVDAGTLVRGYTPMRHRIADSGEFGQLLRRSATAPSWTAVETPIIEKLATIAEGGLRFRYFDAAGSAMDYGTLSSNLNRIMRVQVKIAAKSEREVSRDGSNRFQDSLVANVYLRGNFRTQ